jgi:hypothetical protein
MMVNVLMNVSPCCLRALIETFLGCFLRGHHGRDGMTVVSSNAVYGELYSIQHYVIKLFSIANHFELNRFGRLMKQPK